MRTTLDLDERALVAAKAKAAADGTSLGRAVSALIEEALSSHETPVGFPMFPATDAHVITDELVAAHRDD